VLLIQVVAACLLLLGSALIFRALVAMDLADQSQSPTRPRLIMRRHGERDATSDDTSLPHAA
jgi:hypothetical protein